MSWSIRGKRVLITGATDGVGKQTALELVRPGAGVVLRRREENKAETAAQEILASAGGGDVRTICADLSRMAEVRAMAGSLLTGLLLDLLKKSAPSRIITVSSIAHERARFDPDGLQGEIRFDAHEAYAGSKPANVLFSIELAQRLGGTRVTSTCLHPGVVDTKLLHAGFPASVGGALRRGALTTVYLAASPEVEGVSGAYFVDGKQVRPSPRASDPGARHSLWNLSEELTGHHFTATSPVP